MNRLVHSRILMSVLVVLLQVGLLPDQGRVRCMLRSGLVSCCCPHHDEVPPADVDTSAQSEHGCCNHHDEADAPDDPKLPRKHSLNDGAAGDEACSCGLGTEAPTAILSTPGKEDQRGKHNTTALPVSCVTWSLDGIEVSKRCALRAIPRAETGPPLHLLYQVFLI